MPVQSVLHVFLFPKKVVICHRFENIKLALDQDQAIVLVEIVSSYRMGSTDGAKKVCPRLLQDRQMWQDARVLLSFCNRTFADRVFSLPTTPRGWRVFNWGGGGQ